jgi:hypothetical protein
VPLPGWRRIVVEGLLEDDGAVAVAEAVEPVEGVARRRVPSSIRESGPSLLGSKAPGASAATDTAEAAAPTAGGLGLPGLGRVPQLVLELPDDPLLPQDYGLALRQVRLDLLLLPAEPRLEQQQLRREAAQLFRVLACQSSHELLLLSAQHTFRPLCSTLTRDAVKPQVDGVLAAEGRGLVGWGGGYKDRGVDPSNREPQICIRNLGTNFYSQV